ncbi:hypothetical protein [Vibrio sonorensis]|uniref:hypothetical protein n=1 Tax=Vibrio sonorensis TaxID=1004316 RepID=UPI0008DA14D9|nr:hypothetical protein [Vibrio sonorensis]
MGMEFSHLLETEDGELVVFDDAQSEGEQVRFWLNTPQGQVWGKPWWGNPFAKFRHEPLDENLQADITMDVLADLKRDLPHISIRDILVEQIDTDAALITLVTKKGATPKKSLKGFGNAV